MHVNTQYLETCRFMHLDSLARCNRQQFALDLSSSAQFARNPNVNTKNSAFNFKPSDMCNYCHDHHNKYQFTANYSSFATTEDGHKKHTRNSKKPEGHTPKERKINDSSSMTHRPDQQYKNSMDNKL